LSGGGDRVGAGRGGAGGSRRARFINIRLSAWKRQKKRKKKRAAKVEEEEEEEVVASAAAAASERRRWGKIANAARRIDVNKELRPRRIQGFPGRAARAQRSLTLPLPPPPPPPPPLPLPSPAPRSPCSPRSPRPPARPTRTPVSSSFLGSPRRFIAVIVALLCESLAALAPGEGWNVRLPY
jgi:hypothetical protein